MKREKGRPRGRPQKNFFGEISRPYQDPMYKKWRKDVIERDNHCCQWPMCSKKTRLEVHHIKKWSEFPLLRYNIQNGITLCREHHKSIKNKEADFENLFTTILNYKLFDRLNKLKYGNK